MDGRKCILHLIIVLAFFISISGCSNQAPAIAFHAKSSLVDQSDSEWSEPIFAKKGQALEAVYSLSITKGTWAIWFTRSNETDPRYYYSAYDNNYQGKIKYPVPETGNYVLHIKSENFTGSYDVTIRVIK